MTDRYFIKYRKTIEGTNEVATIQGVDAMCKLLKEEGYEIVNVEHRILTHSR